MRVLISGVCGFVGSELALGLHSVGYEVCGFDDFSRPGSERDRPRIEAAGIEFWRGDVRQEEDLARVKGIDWVIDAAANPSVLAGVDGRPDQGIFSYWIHSWAQRAPLKYSGFGGTGHQVRDCLHPDDLLALLVRQMDAGARAGRRIFNVGGGAASPRPFDLPWVVLDAACAGQEWDWRPEKSVDEICREIARHAREHPEWLEVSRG